MTQAQISALLACALLAATAAAQAGEAPPQLGRYLPKYPAIYYTFGYETDDRDSSFGQDGSEHDTAVPTVAGQTAFPETRYRLDFTSYFPLFEDAGIPFLSDRLYSARMSLRHGKTQTEGTLRGFIASNPDFAPRSKYGDSGIGDVSFEFGSFLLGASDWRNRKDTPFALELLTGFDLPVGDYEQTAPVTQGSNRFAYGATLGAHWRPWSGGFVEGGAGIRDYGSNKNPHFGHLSPAQQGRDLRLNLGVTQRVFRGAYLGAFITDRHGDPNEYRNVRYAPNAPQPNPAPPGGTTESFPLPGTHYDGGTALRTAGLSLSYFVTQRLAATLDYTRPLSGKSGEFVAEFRQRQCPAGSEPGSGGCTEADMGPTVVDGQGSARSFSSDSLRFALSYNFGHADLYSCTGCRQ